MKKIIVSFCAVTALITTSYAMENQRGDTPPAEAIEICVGQESGTLCTMETPRGTLTGQCMYTPDDKYFVCMPEGGPDNGRPEKR